MAILREKSYVWKDEQFILYFIWCFIEVTMVYIIQCIILKEKNIHSLCFNFSLLSIQLFYQETVAYFKYTNI